MEMVQQILMDLVAKYPMIVGILSAIGLLRLIIKPAMDIFKAYVKWTVDPKDDVLPEQVEQSKLYKGLMYVLDLVASIKPKK